MTDQPYSDRSPEPYDSTVDRAPLPYVPGVAPDDVLDHLTKQQSKQQSKQTTTRRKKAE